MTSLLDWRQLSNKPAAIIEDDDPLLEKHFDDAIDLAERLGLLSVSFPQFGVPKRGFVLQAPEGWVSAYNPMPLIVEAESVTLPEAHPNFSVSGFVIHRPTALRLRYTEFPSKRKRTVLARGLTAREVLIQLDYLGGTSPLDRLGALKRAMVEKKLRKHDRRDRNE